jgi:uncharacterized protein
LDPILWWHALAALLVLVGLAGVVVPVLPGIPLLFFGLWVSAWAGGFEHVGFWTLLILGKLAVLSVLIDILAGLAGARRLGASTRGIVGAGLGTIVGLMFGLVGVLLGPFVGAVLGELAHGRRIDHASRVGVGTWIGLVVATAAKIAIAFAMLGVFAVGWWL